MRERRDPTFVPVATLKTKDAVRSLASGQSARIDVVNKRDPSDAMEVLLWAFTREGIVHFSYQDGTLGGMAYLGPADVIRAKFEHSDMES